MISKLLKLIALSIITSLSLFYGFIVVLRLTFQTLIRGRKVWTVKKRTEPPNCLQDPENGQHSYVNLKDIKIHYVEKGDRSKPLILFVHGFPEFWYSWRHQLKHFAKTHWAVAIDLRGYGDSGKPKNINDYDIAILANDIKEFVKALGRDNCILVGHDWGGGVCWQVASTHSEIVNSLIILNCPHPGGFRKKLQSSLKQFFKSWYMFFFQLPYLPEIFMRSSDMYCFKEIYKNYQGKPFVSGEDLEAYKYTFNKFEDWTGPINYYRSVFRNRLFSLEKLPVINAKTLVIWGEDDLALEKDLAELSLKFVRDGKVVYIPYGNHFIQQDQPQQVNKIMDEFLKK